MVEELDIRRPWVLRQVVTLQRAAFEIERGLYPELAIPALRISARTVLGGDEICLGIRRRFRLLGLVTYRRTGPAVEICRLMVREGHWREGIGTRLMEGVEAMEPLARTFVVLAADANHRAIALYRRMGYHPAGRMEPMPGLVLERMEKRRGAKTSWV